MIRTGVTNVNKSESISFIRTVAGTNFTSAIVMNDHIVEDLSGLSDDRIVIKEINVQSVQNLKYKLWFWSNNTFDNVSLDVDSYRTSVLIDLTNSNNETVDRLNNANQYYLDIRGLSILYEDLDESNEIHCSLQNLSRTAKIAGSLGAVQLDIAYTPRL